MKISRRGLLGGLLTLPLAGTGLVLKDSPRLPKFHWAQKRLFGKKLDPNQVLMRNFQITHELGGLSKMYFETFDKPDNYRIGQWVSFKWTDIQFAGEIAKIETTSLSGELVLSCITVVADPGSHYADYRT